MKIYKIDSNNTLIQYAEQDFKLKNFEAKLEDWLANNPHCILEEETILIIGRQVSTNLGSVIDLLAVDRSGDSLVIELKRDRTPRETIAQILEYASFVDALQYKQIEEIFTQYTNEDNINLADYHRSYFQLTEDEAVAFNKNQKLVIIAQVINREVKQISTYLRKKGVDFYCLEFKYFTNEKSEKIISTDLVVGADTDSIKKVSSGSLPRVNPTSFIASLDQNGKTFFESILNFAEKNKYPIHWGSKGFSLNADLNGTHINILYGYPPHAVFKQSIYTACVEIIKKVEDGESIVEYFRQKLLDLDGFEQAGTELKLMINKPKGEKTEPLQTIFSEVIAKIIEHGLKE